MANSALNDATRVQSLCECKLITTKVPGRCVLEFAREYEDRHRFSGMSHQIDGLILSNGKGFSIIDITLRHRGFNAQSLHVTLNDDTFNDVVREPIDVCAIIPR